MPHWGLAYLLFCGVFIITGLPFVYLGELLAKLFKWDKEEVTGVVWGAWGILWVAWFLVFMATHQE